MSKHLVIPDTQVRPGDDLSFLKWIGNYIVDKRPDTIIQIGDFVDMPSLSSYDVGKKSFEGRRYKDDCLAAENGMKALLGPIKDLNKQLNEKHDKRYRPRRILTLGNHCDRITRAVNSDPKLEGTIGLGDLGYEKFGWEVVPYLDVIVVDGVAYSHYFPSGQLGRPCTSARAMLNKMHMSCVAGHQQGRDIAFGRRADGVDITAIIAGSCYLHDEPYLTPMTNRHWRGVLMLHNVTNGAFDEMLVSLDYLKQKYS